MLRRRVEASCVEIGNVPDTGKTRAKTLRVRPVRFATLSNFGEIRIWMVCDQWYRHHPPANMIVYTGWPVICGPRIISQPT